MAFTSNNFVALSSVSNTNAGKVFQYKEDATLAAVRASGYFNDANPEYGLTDGDVVMLICNDGIGFSSVTVTSGVVAVDESITSA